MSTAVTTRTSNELTRAAEIAPDRNPALVYLGSLAPGSQRAQRGALERVARMVGGPRAELERFAWTSLRYQHVARVKSLLVDEELAPATVNRILAALKGVTRESWRLGYVDAEELRRVEDIKSVKGSTLPSGRALSMAEIQTLGDSCALDTAGGARDRAMLVVLFGAGLRRAELTALELADYAPATGELRIRRGKGGKERIAYVTNGSRDLLGAWLERRGPAAGALFCPVGKSGRVTVARMSEQAVYAMLKRMAAGAGVAGFSPHDLRRTFVGELLDRGADLAAVQGLAGHADPRTTARYDRRGERVRRKAAELLHVPFGK